MKRLLVLLALALPLASCARNPDDTTDVRDAPAPPRVVFVGEPTFVLVPGTNTYWYDNTTGDVSLYRFGDMYYLMNGNAWYRGYDHEGPFRAVVFQNVPDDVMSAVEYRQRYGDNRLRSRRGDDVARRGDDEAYRERYDDGRRDQPGRGPAAINVNVQRPQFARVSDNGVWYARNTPGSYEMFRYRGDFFVYRNGTWYRNDEARGTYRRIARGTVPGMVVSAASRVMSRDWRRNVGY